MAAKGIVSKTHYFTEHQPRRRRTFHLVIETEEGWKEATSENDTLQGQGLCALCKKREPKDTFFLDHDHQTDEIRGLLCPACNALVGAYEMGRLALFDECKGTIEEYLRKPPAKAALSPWFRSLSDDSLTSTT